MVKERGDEGKDDQRKQKGKMVEDQIRNAKKPVGHYKCPRCDSDHTKFCYYNNNSITQPRYLCKNCRRYWTQGGYQRNIPIGGGIRKVSHGKDSSSCSGGEIGSSSNVTPHLLVTNLSSMANLLTSSFGMYPGIQSMRTSSLETKPAANSQYTYNRSTPDNVATGMKNMSTTLQRGNNWGIVSIPYGFNRFETGSLQQGGAPPIHGGVSPIQSIVPPIQGEVAPIQGRVPPIEGGVPPVHGRGPPILGGVPPIQARIPPINDGFPATQGGFSAIQGGFPPFQGRVPPTIFSTYQIRMSNNNNQNIINQGKESMFLGDFLPYGENFYAMKGNGNNITYQPNQSFNQASRLIDFSNRGITNTNNFNSINLMPASRNHTNNINNTNSMNASSSTTCNNFSGNNNDEDEDDQNNNSFPKTYLSTNKWPDYFPDFDPPEI